MDNSNVLQDWDLDNRVTNLDLTDDYALHNKYVMQVNSKPYSEETGWELAGKYDFDKNEWNFGSGRPGFDFNFLNTK